MSNDDTELRDEPETEPLFGNESDEADDERLASPPPAHVGATPAPTPIQFPDDWPRPSGALLRDLDAAAAAAKVPRALMYAVARRESAFNPRAKGKVHAANSKGFARSFDAYKARTIPGSSLTWGEMFPRPEDWTAHGVCMLLPFNIVGRQGGVRAGAALSDLLKPKPNTYRAARMLADAYQKSGAWAHALRAYNNSSKYVNEVLELAKELGWEPTP
jgi:hypothetical protein